MAKKISDRKRLVALVMGMATREEVNDLIEVIEAIRDANFPTEKAGKRPRKSRKGADESPKSGVSTTAKQSSLSTPEQRFVGST